MTTKAEVNAAINRLIDKQLVEIDGITAKLERDVFRELPMAVRAVAIATGNANTLRQSARTILEKRRDKLTEGLRVLRAALL